MSSWANSTLKQYSCSIKAWVNFCQDHPGYSYQKPTKTSLLAFRTQRFNNGASYGTLNTDGAAISVISDDKIGEDPEISRFFKAVFRLRPQKLRYIFTWDTSTVLNYPKGLISDDLSHLSQNLVMLLALGTAQRVQTLKFIIIKNIQFNPEGVITIIDEIIKTSARNRPSPVLKFPYFQHEKDLCIAKCLKDYLNFTENIRNNVDELLISIKKTSWTCFYSNYKYMVERGSQRKWY